MLYYHDFKQTAMVMVNPEMIPDVASFEKDMDNQGWIKFEETNFKRLQENIEGSDVDRKLIRIRRTELTKLTQKNPSGYIGFKNNNLIKIDDDDDPMESFTMKYPIQPIKEAKPALMKIKGEVNVVVGERLPMSITHYYDKPEKMVFLMYVAPRITFE